MKNESKLSVSFILTFFSIAVVLNDKWEITTSGFRGEFQTYVNYIVNSNQRSLINLQSLQDPVLVDILSTADTFPGLTLLYIFITSITKLPAQRILLLPFGVIFTFIAYFMLVRRFFDVKIALVSIVYLCFIALTSTGQLGGYAIAFTTILLIIVIMSSISILYSSKANRWSLIFILSYLGLFSIWHTMEGRAIFFLISIAFFTSVVKFPTKNRSNIRLYPIIALVITLFFKRWLFDSTGGYFASLSVSRVIVAYQQRLYLLGNILGFSETYTSEPVPWYIATPVNEFASISTSSTLLLYLFILIPIGVASLSDVISILHSKSFNEVKNFTHLMMWVLLLMWVGQFLAYSLAGQASLGMIRTLLVISAFFSIYILHDKYLSSVSVWNISAHKSLIAFILILTVVAGAGSLQSVNGYIQTEAASYEDLETSSQWYGEYTPSNKSGLTDFETRGKILSVSSVNGRILRLKTIRSHHYVGISNKNIKGKWKYLIVDNNRASHPIETDHFREKMKSIGYIEKNITSNPDLGHIYSDGTIDIYSRNNNFSN